MKNKLLTILTISAIFTAALFAKEATVQLTNTVDAINFTYDLYYQDELIVADTTKTIAVGSITSDDLTNKFKILASGNQNSNKTVTVTIDPGYFKTKLNGSETYNYTSTVLPQVIKDDNLILTLTPGLHEDVKVFGFYLKWTGDPNLPAGDYVSDISVEYTID